jgi:hypothetical protein
MWKIITFCLLSSFLLMACKPAQHPQHRATHATNLRPPDPPPPPDLSFLDSLGGHCAAKVPGNVTLTAAEKCWTKELSTQCSPANDCLVACLASGQARLIGGGCWHVCWDNVPGFNTWRKPTGAAQCKSLGHVNGI